MAEKYRTEEAWHILADGHKVYTKTWKPTEPPKALLLLIHGFSDHVNSYYTLFPRLASAHSIQTHGFDQRGWGRSVSQPSEKGLTGPTETVLDDITQLLRTQLPVAKELGVPLFVLGHSMGGGQILQFAAKGPSDVRSQIRGYLAEAPYIALHPSAQPSKLLEVAGKMAAKVLPKRQMVQQLDSKWICRDTSVCKDYENDKLCHDTGTLEGLSGMLQRASELDHGDVMPTEGRFWFGHGNEDHITSYDSSRRLFERLGEGIKDKEFKTYEGHYHKLHAEPGDDKIVFADDVAAWILARSGPEGDQVASKL